MSSTEGQFISHGPTQTVNRLPSGAPTGGTTMYDFAASGGSSSGPCGRGEPGKASYGVAEGTSQMLGPPDMDTSDWDGLYITAIVEGAEAWPSANYPCRGDGGPSGTNPIMHLQHLIGSYRGEALNCINDIDMQESDYVLLESPKVWYWPGAVVMPLPTFAFTDTSNLNIVTGFAAVTWAAARLFSAPATTLDPPPLLPPAPPHPEIGPYILPVCG